MKNTYIHTYIHTYMHTYLLACLIFSSMLNAANYQALDNRPDFVNLSPQPLSEIHRRQANLGQGVATVSASYIHFNLNALNTIKGDKGKFYNIKNTQMSGQEIALRFPNIDKPVLLYVDNVQNLVEGVITYTGYRVEDSNDFFTLSVSDDGVMAKINYGKYIYVIKPIKSRGSKHTIVQLEKSLMVKGNIEDIVGENKLSKTKSYVEKSSSGSGHVEILFYYASDVYWPSLYVSGIVSEMNAALSRSGVASSNYISSVGLIPTGTDFNGLCNSSIIDLMANSQGAFANINQELVTYGADLAFTISGDFSANNCYPGLSGRIYGWAYLYNPSYPFAIAPQAYVLSNLTALHEIGHNLGGSHSNVYTGTNGTASSARGLIFTVNSDVKQTLMGAYSSPCDFTGLYSACERIDYFTNPSKLYSGVTLGDSTRNMKSWLNTSMPVVSNYRGAPVPPPNVPNPISSNNESCFGLNSVTWTAQSGATEYKLYKSTSSSFTSPVMLYSGTNTTTAVNVGSGTWYLRAQACNASGCSVYSNQVTAYRVSGCL